jgi:hypothetical protein
MALVGVKYVKWHFESGSMLFVNSSYIQQLSEIWMVLNVAQKYNVARYFMFPKVLEMLGTINFCTFLCVKNLVGLVIMSTSVAFANMSHSNITMKRSIMEINFHPVVIDTWFFHTIASTVVRYHLEGPF